ncbi:MAG: low specificity L-threonine aldolase [Gammaproteobacteria bacterium]
MIFGSDNQSGASPQVLKAITDAYSGTSDDAYGDDSYCAKATETFKQVFETDVSVFYVVSGTAANTLALSAMLKPWEGVICHHQAHILLDESSGPALFTGGAALLPVPSKNLKLTPSALTSMLERLPNEPPHNIRPGAISVSQASECGQIYSVNEIHSLCAVAKSADLLVHMDGARFANAVAELGCKPADITWRAGVDVLCLGATKNGAVAAEAIIFFNHDLAEDFNYRLKRTGHLVSKGRLFGAQFQAWLQGDHWLTLAGDANRAAVYLRECLNTLEGIRPAFDCQSNESFVILKKERYDNLLKEGVSMYSWYLDTLPPEIEIQEDEVLARMVTSFTTKNSEIDRFVQLWLSYDRTDK